jgi:hypothetical protein
MSRHRSRRLAALCPTLVVGCAGVALIAAHPADRGQAAPAASATPAAASIDLRRAVIVTPATTAKAERTAVRVLIEEVEKRSLVRLPVSSTWPGATVPVIAVGLQETARAWAKPVAASAAAGRAAGREGYRIHVDTTSRTAPTVLVLGSDSRGMLFGVGRLLRELHMTRAGVSLAAGIQISTAPKVALRGHQLGYRPKTNSYDGWDVAMWEQYIRDLAVFGTNAIELIPPRSDDAADSPHFPLPQLDMMVEMSRLADEYGMQVWIWYPALDKDYADPKQVDFALGEWGAVFARLPRIDAVFVPGGDPGHTQPKHLFALLERQTANLRKHHPRAQMWMSPQSFTLAWMDEFYDLMRAEPAWLGGIVFGPQNRDGVPVLRQKIPARYPIRHYPDITHSLRSQYAVPEWDVAHALTSQREPINPRPVDQATIFRALLPHVQDFITYSEGCNDDVNKIVWSALGWDPQTDVLDVVRDYSQYFIGDRYRETFAKGLLALERNWKGPLAGNASVDETLAHFQALERDAAPRDLLNWRFQQALYRAYYDAYQRSRLLHESALEERAMERLRAARTIGSRTAIEQANAVLDEAERARPSPEWRLRVFSLAEALFQSIRMQLSVGLYKAIAVGRGATLDLVDTPLNNRGWLSARFKEILAAEKEEDRLAAIYRIVSWTDPGPGGFYDDLGNPTRQPHLVPGPGLEKDPGMLESPSVGFAYRPEWRLSWITHAESFWEAPVNLRYTGLDRAARYRVRVVYAGETGPTPVLRLVANGSIEVHAPIKKENPVKPLEFDIPVEATRGGELTLTWTQARGTGGAGRGNQIAEVWLMRTASASAAVLH